MTDALGDQLAAATADTRRTVDTMRARTRATGETGRAAPWVAELLDAVIATKSGTCDHLILRPIQSAFAFTWERYFRCRPCLEDHARRMAEAIRRAATADSAPARKAPATCAAAT